MSNHYGTSRPIKRELVIYGFARPRAKFANENAEALLGQVRDSQGHLELTKTQKLFILILTSFIVFIFVFVFVFVSVFAFFFILAFVFVVLLFFLFLLIFFSFYFRFYYGISRPPHYYSVLLSFRNRKINPIM